jgi:hypothetical protein
VTIAKGHEDDFFLSRRGSVAAVAREVANVLKQGFASDETVSSVYETRLKRVHAAWLPIGAYEVSPCGIPQPLPWV